MRDELERLIWNNRAVLQDEEPLDGHFERFEMRLKRAQRPVRRIHFRTVVKAAAAVIFVLLAVNQARIYFFAEKKQTLTLGSISPEYREVEFYYTSSIQQEMAQWNEFKREGLVSEPDQQMMHDEQKEFDQVYQKLILDLNANPNDERVINALIAYYQSRMNVISIMTSKLQEIKQKKYRKNENPV